VQTSQPDVAAFTIQVVPLIYLLWVGVVAMCMGTTVELVALSRKNVSTQNAEPV
jgi:hypothetical protein